jgi:hypothetical protein
VKLFLSESLASEGDELLQFIDKRVRASGTVEDEGNGIKIIMVTSFEVIE